MLFSCRLGNAKILVIGNEKGKTLILAQKNLIGRPLLTSYLIKSKLFYGHLTIFLNLLAKVTESFWFFLAFLAKVSNGESFGHFGHMVTFVGHFHHECRWWKLCDLVFAFEQPPNASLHSPKAISGTLLCKQKFVLGRQLLTWDCKYEYICTLAGNQETCSNCEKTQQAFESSLKKEVFVLGFHFFMSGVISEVDFWPFWLVLPGLGPNS